MSTADVASTLEGRRRLMDAPPAIAPGAVASPAGSADTAWRGLYRVGGIAAVSVLVSIPAQVAVYLIWPPPTDVAGFFALFQRNWLLGLLNLDLLYVVTSVLMIPLFLALGAALWRTSPAAILAALGMALVGLAAYFPTNPAFEMLTLSRQHAGAATDAERALFLSAGEAMLATYTGTAFDVYYVLNGAALLTIAVVMLRSGVFGKATAYVGIVAGLLFLVPSTAGAIGAAFSLACLVPWTIYSVLIARRLLKLGREASVAPGR